MTTDREPVLRIRGGKKLRGSARVPPDLEIAQRVLVFAALSDGRCELQALEPHSADALAPTLSALAALGVPAAHGGDVLRLDGVGLHGLRMPNGALDCGRSPSTLALIAGLLSAQSFGTRITVHSSLADRPLTTLLEALRARGAQIAGRTQGSGLVAPIAVAPLVAGEALHGIDCTLPAPDPEAKTALLVSGLFARGTTTISEPCISADHTERALIALGAPLRRIGSVVSFDPSTWDRHLPGLGTLTLPGSASVAAYLAVAAQLLPGSDVELQHVGINPSRSGVLDMLRGWATGLQIEPTGDAGLREPVGKLRLRHAAVRGGVIGGELLARARDELPALALLGAVATRGVRLCDLGWLATEADPSWSKLDPLFQAFGLRIERQPGELFLAPGVLQPAQVDAQDDPRLALCACILGLASPGESVVEHAARALSSAFPGFLETARSLGADIDVT